MTGIGCIRLRNTTPWKRPKIDRARPTSTTNRHPKRLTGRQALRYAPGDFRSQGYGVPVYGGGAYVRIWPKIAQSDPHRKSGRKSGQIWQNPASKKKYEKCQKHREKTAIHQNPATFCKNPATFFENPAKSGDVFRKSGKNAPPPSTTTPFPSLGLSHGPPLGASRDWDLGRPLFNPMSITWIPSQSPPHDPRPTSYFCPEIRAAK